MGPSGDVRFTSDSSQCRHAAIHAPRTETLQRTEKVVPPLASARPGAAAGSRLAAPDARDTSAAAEATWRGKKAEAESKLQTLEAAHDKVLAEVHWCNQGKSVLRESSRTGLREQVPCRDVDAARAKIESELEEARAYLASGLEDECRQAGCMPGWLR